MCNAKNHPDNCCCGWGGEGHKGRGSLSSRNGVVAGGVNRAMCKGQTTVHLTKASFISCNSNCPVCGAEVYFYQSSDGGRVYFDEIGPPWPKHPCTDSSLELPVRIDNWIPCKCGRSYISKYSGMCPICSVESSEPNRISTIKRNLKLIAKRLRSERIRLKFEENKYQYRVSVEKYDLEIKRLNDYWCELSMLDPRYTFKIFDPYN